MERDVQLLIIGDVHGRDFWREPVKECLGKSICFLGDYLDPYEMEGVTKSQALDIFREIIALKKDNPNITLLLGNHDAGYALSTSICECRHDWRNAEVIAELFETNSDLFDLAYEKRIGGKTFLLSHAGIHDVWVKSDTFAFPKGFRKSAKNFNELLHTDDNGKLRGLICALGDVSYYRGGYESYGSMLWADIREFWQASGITTKKIQIVGHTMLNGAAINFKNKFYCVDCKRAVYIDSKGDVRYYDTTEIIEPLSEE